LGSIPVVKKSLFITGSIVIIGALLCADIWHARYGAQNYLAIPEWGVRLRLPSDLQGDIAYRASKSGAPTLILYSRKLAAKASSCQAEGLALNMRLARSISATTYKPFQLHGYRNGTFKHIGTYYYAVLINPTDDRNWCFLHEPNARDPAWPEAKRISDELYKALSTLEATKT
jgi:hypothetical protein